MLIQFRVENHRSLRDEQVLNLCAALGTEVDPRLIRTEGLDEGLLRAVAIYGANASGKSNVISAISFMRNAVLTSQRLWEPEQGVPRDPFQLSAAASQPSVYEVDMLVAGVRHRYGFVLSAEKVEEEWLYAWPHGRKQTWFERDGDTFDFGKNLHGENETIRGLTRANSLFLSAAAQNNHPTLLPIFRWFRFDVRPARGRLGPFGPRYAPAFMPDLYGIFSTQLALPGLDDDARQRERDEVVRLLAAADTGIVGIKVEQRDDPDRPPSRRFSVHFRHKTAEEQRSWLPAEVESDGTLTLLELAGRLLRVLRDGGLLWVDELEASLHPMLAMELVRMFNDPTHNQANAQLIFTTHDTNLLGSVLGEPLLRRDQVWFTEKDVEGASHLYPLTDFRPRKEENLERGYLQGRYGAIPFLGSLLQNAGTPTKAQGD